MYKQCKNKNAIKRQEELAEQIIEMLQKKKLDNVTVSELCGHVNVPRKSFYRYFESKDDIRQYLIDRYIKTYLEYDSKQASPENSVEALMVTLSYWKANRKLMIAIMNSGAIPLLEDSISEYLTERGFGEFASIHSKDSFAYTLGVRLLVHCVFVIITDWLQTNCRASVPDAAALIVDVITNPLVKTKKQPKI